MKQIDAEVAIIGGGIAGLTSALSLADMGFRIVLVEKKENLGGHAAQWACMATDSCAKCSACTVEKNIESACNHPLIRIATKAEVSEFNGIKGDFSLKVLSSNGNDSHRIPQSENTNQLTIKCKNVLLTSGFKEFDATRKVMLSYGRIPEVINIKDIDDALKRDQLENLFPDTMQNARIAFIMCVGSRDRMNGNDYCSQFCGKTSIRLINRLKYLKPRFTFDMYYIDLQIMCKEFCNFYNKMQKVVTFYQGLPAEVLDGPEKGTVKIYAANVRSGNFEERIYHRVVLAIGISPNQDNTRLSELTGIPLNEFGFFEHSHENGAYNSTKEGIYLAGASAGPTDITSTRMQALSASHHIALDLKSTN